MESHEIIFLTSGKKSEIFDATLMTSIVSPVIADELNPFKSMILIPSHRTKSGSLSCAARISSLNFHMKENQKYDWRRSIVVIASMPLKAKGRVRKTKIMSVQDCGECKDPSTRSNEYVFKKKTDG